MKPKTPAKRKKSIKQVSLWDQNMGYLILKSLCDEFSLSLVKEFKFCPTGTRRYRFDYCIPELNIGIEFDGGIWRGDSSHSSPTGITRDIEKGNYAQLCGYTWFRFTYQQPLTYLYDTIKQTIINAKK